MVKPWRINGPQTSSRRFLEEAQGDVNGQSPQRLNEESHEPPSLHLRSRLSRRIGDYSLSYNLRRTYGTGRGLVGDLPGKPMRERLRSLFILEAFPAAEHDVHMVEQISRGHD